MTRMARVDRRCEVSTSTIFLKLDGSIMLSFEKTIVVTMVCFLSFTNFRNKKIFLPCRSGILISIGFNNFTNIDNAGFNAERFDEINSNRNYLETERKKKISTIKKMNFKLHKTINHQQKKQTQKCLQKRKFQLCFHRDSNRIRKTLETVLETLRYLNLSRNLYKTKNKHHTFELKSISFN